LHQHTKPRDERRRRGTEKDAAARVEEGATVFFREPAQHHAPLHGHTIITTPPLCTAKHTAVNTLAETSSLPHGH